MTHSILELIKDFRERKIEKEQFIQKLSIELGFTINEKSCLEKIDIALNEHDSEAIDLFVLVGFMVGFTSESLPLMCKLLSSPEHHNHEDIATFLKEIADPTTADCLYSAAELQFDYLDYDETYQFGRKCIKALAAIGDKNSVSKLKLLSESNIVEISEHSKNELLNLGID